MKKIAVITGASSGIGRACGHALKKDYVIYNLSRSGQEKDFYNYKVDVNDFVKIEEIAKEILYIAEKSLIEMNTCEEKFLEPVKELTFAGLCPADIILRNWNGLWNKDVKKLVKYLSR